MGALGCMLTGHKASEAVVILSTEIRPSGNHEHYPNGERDVVIRIWKDVVIRIRKATEQEMRG